MIRTLTYFCLFLVACQPKPDLEALKSDVVATEKAFAALAAEEGLAVAFEEYAAPDGVINRNRTTIQGKADIRAYYDSQPDDGSTLEWEPSFVDVAASGDLAYTYGPYTFTVPDSLGNPTEFKGIFHTVWRIQPDGTWRFVWD